LNKSSSDKKPNIKNLKERILSIFKKIIYGNPSIFFTFKPLKIYEFKELIKDIKFSKQDIVLDIGCGQGLSTLLIGKKCKKIYGIDISKKGLIIAERRAKSLRKKVNSVFRQVKLENAKFKEGFFDKIVSICVLEHILNYKEVLIEIYRILKEGGPLLLSVDSLETIENTKFLEYHKKKCSVRRYFTKNDLMQILKEIGFKKILVYPIFKSEYSKKLYIRSIKDKNEKSNKLNHLNFIYRYLILKFAEALSLNKNKGIYLIAKCYK